MLGQEHGAVPVRESPDVDDPGRGTSRPRAGELARELGYPFRDRALVVPVGVDHDEAAPLVRRHFGRDGPVEVGHHDVGDEARREARRGSAVGGDDREGVGACGTPPDGWGPGPGREADDDDLPTSQALADPFERAVSRRGRQHPLQAGEGHLLPVERQPQLGPECARSRGAQRGVLHAAANPANAL